MTKKETIEMLAGMKKDLERNKNGSWWQGQEIKTLTSAIKLLKKK